MMKKNIFNFGFLFLTVFIFGSLVFASSADITQIKFTSDHQSINANTASTVLSIQTQDATGAETQTGETNHLNLTSTSATGQFSYASISE